MLDLTIHEIDARRHLIVPGDEEETLTFCVEQFTQLAQTNIQEKGRFSVALSGGSTPKALFEKVTQEPYLSQIDWTKVFLFWSDERSVPPDHPESNYAMAMEAGFKKVPIPKKQIFRMKAEGDIEKQAKEYEKTVKEVLGKDLFDLVMLGMGEDGHIASLFPNTAALEKKERLVVENFIPEKSTWRMTLTFSCINQSSQVNLYVLGEKKQKMVKKILESEKPTNLPAEKIGTDEHKALWILDQKASAKLSQPFL